jgi:hypothetical protein
MPSFVQSLDPNAPTPVIDLSKDAAGNPVLADLAAQVEHDWNHLPSTAVKQKRNSDPQYAAALTEYLAKLPSAAVAESTEPESSAVSPAAIVAEPPVVEPVFAPVPATVAPVAVVPEEDADPNLVKTKEGWEYRIDLGDGSGVQAFKGRTKNQVLAAMGKAQINATKKIRAQAQERKALISEENPDFDAPLTRLKPGVLNADEQWEFANSMTDPAKAAKAMDKYIERRLGGSIDVIVEAVNRQNDDLEYRRAFNEGKAWIAETPEFYNTPENGQKIANYIQQQGWANTKRNLRKAFIDLSEAGELEVRPAEPVPTLEAVIAAPEVVIPPEPAAVATVAAPPEPPQTLPAGLPPGRVRPGSTSTGLSPRDASVRPGATPAVRAVGLTAEEYHRMPTSDMRRKFNSDPVFKAAVNALIDEGKI